MSMRAQFVIPVLASILILGTFPLPSTYAYPATGDIIVSDLVANAIFAQNSAGGPPLIIYQGSPYVGPVRTVQDPATGDIIVADIGSATIFRQNPAGGPPLIIYQGAPYVLPIHVTIEPLTGDIIVADQSGIIFRQNPAGGPPLIIHQGEPYGNLLNGVAVEPSTGDIIVADGDGIIFRQDPDGGDPIVIHQGEPYDNPTSVIVEPATGDLIVTDCLASTIFRQDPDGGDPIVIHQGVPYECPADATIEPSTGDIIVAEFDDENPAIFRQNPAGEGDPIVIYQGAPYIQPAGVFIFLQVNQQVDIDIKPGGEPNCFNNDVHGVIPVAILGSASFDATQVDPLTLSLDGQSVKTKRNGTPQANIENVNGDGFNDLVVKIIDIDGTYAVGTGTGTLTGQLFDGTPFEGSDSICITQ